MSKMSGWLGAVALRHAPEQVDNSNGIQHSEALFDIINIGTTPGLSSMRASEAIV